MSDNQDKLTEMIWKVANGEIPSKKAAEICGLNYHVFYKRLRKNVEAYMVFRKKVSKRTKPLVENKYNSKYKRDSDETKALRLKKTMDSYHAKSKIADKVAQAKAKGLSYGYYMAMVNGYGRL